MCLQEVCACLGECGYRRGVLLVTEDGCTCTKSVWLGGMRLYRKYAAIQEVHACAGGVRLYRMGDIIWQVRRL